MNRAVNSESGPIVVPTRPMGEGLAEGLRGVLPSTETVIVCDGANGVPADAQVLVTLAGDPDAIRELLAPSIEWVHVLGAGVDGFPFDALGDRPLTCSRGAASVAIAEWVMAVMLAHEKSLPKSWISAPTRWNMAALGTLAGRTVALVGIGAIGTEVARRALAFDARVIGFRRTPTPAALSDVEVVPDLPGLLARADHLVLAAPATSETHHLMDAAAFGALKRGAHVVNVARGSLIDQEALRVALDDGLVARASLDTVEPEPLPEGHWLYAHRSVRLSPHVSWSSPHTMEKTVSLFAQNLARFRSGGALDGLVDPVAGY